MLHFPLHRYGIELFLYGLHAADEPHAVLTTYLLLDDVGRGKQASASLEELVRAVHTGGLAITETEPVFRALERGQVDTLILAKAYQPDKGWQCTVCNTMNVTRKKPEKCPRCGVNELRDFDVKEEMVRLAERDRCEVEVVEHSDKLGLLGGVGCLLRYRLPEEYCSETEGRAMQGFKNILPVTDQGSGARRPAPGSFTPAAVS